MSFKFNPFTGNLDIVSVDTITIGDPVGSGTNNAILYIDSSGNLASSSNFFYDNSTKTFSVGYDATNYVNTTVASDGGVTVATYGSDGDYSIDLTNATDGDFSVNGDDIFVDTSNGYVGINTSAPAAPIDVVGQGRFFATGIDTTSGTHRGYFYNISFTGNLGNSNNSVGAFYRCQPPSGSVAHGRSFSNVANVLAINDTTNTSNANWRNFNNQVSLSGSNSNFAGTSTITVSRNLFSIISNRSNMTLTNAVVLNAEFNSGASNSLNNTITNLTYVRVNGDIGSGPVSVTNEYGLYMEGLACGTNIYGIYQADSGIINYYNGDTGFGTTSPTQKVDINDDSIRVRTSKTPSSASDTGTQGQIAWDSDYLYVCTATNTWKRVALSTW